jgi:hypothetical protein
MLLVHSSLSYTPHAAKPPPVPAARPSSRCLVVFFTSSPITSSASARALYCHGPALPCHSCREPASSSTQPSGSSSTATRRQDRASHGSSFCCWCWCCHGGQPAGAGGARRRRKGSSTAQGAGGAAVPALRVHGHQVLLLQQLQPRPAAPLLQGMPPLLDPRRRAPQRPRRRRHAQARALSPQARPHHRLLLLLGAAGGGVAFAARDVRAYRLRRDGGAALRPAALHAVVIGAGGVTDDRPRPPPADAGPRPPPAGPRRHLHLPAHPRAGRPLLRRLPLGRAPAGDAPASRFVRSCPAAAARAGAPGDAGGLHLGRHGVAPPLHLGALSCLLLRARARWCNVRARPIHDCSPLIY